MNKLVLQAFAVSACLISILFGVLSDVAKDPLTNSKLAFTVVLIVGLSLFVASAAWKDKP